MKTLFLLVLSALVSSLLGCSESTPPDKLTEKVVRPYAQQDLLSGMEIVDYKRENGWADPNSPNRYIVRYALNYRLTKSIGDVVLENIKPMEKIFSDSIKKSDAMPSSESVTALAMLMTVQQWTGQQGDAIDSRKQKLWSSCQACLDYWNLEDGSKESAKYRRWAMLAVILNIEQAGFTVDAKQGDTAPRWAQASFTKTENGWQAAQ